MNELRSQQEGRALREKLEATNAALDQRMTERRAEWSYTATTLEETAQGVVSQADLEEANRRHADCCDSLISSALGSRIQSHRG